jgi:hypothetical protein
LGCPFPQDDFVLCRHPLPLGGTGHAVGGGEHSASGDERAGAFIDVATVWVLAVDLDQVRIPGVATNGSQSVEWQRVGAGPSAIHQADLVVSS